MEVVTREPLALTPQEVGRVPADRDTVEMDSLAQVKKSGDTRIVVCRQIIQYS